MCVLYQLFGLIIQNPLLFIKLLTNIEHNMQWKILILSGWADMNLVVFWKSPPPFREKKGINDCIIFIFCIQLCSDGEIDHLES